MGCFVQNYRFSGFNFDLEGFTCVKQTSPIPNWHNQPDSTNHLTQADNINL